MPGFDLAVAQHGRSIVDEAWQHLRRCMEGSFQCFQMQGSTGELLLQGIMKFAGDAQTFLLGGGFAFDVMDVPGLPPDLPSENQSTWQGDADDAQQPQKPSGGRVQNAALLRLAPGRPARRSRGAICRV